MCLTFQIPYSETQRGLFIKSASQAPSYVKFREWFLLLCINLSLMLYPWKNLLLIQTLPFTDKKGVLGRLFPIHTPTHTYLQIYICVYIHRESETCSGCCGSLCTKSETLTAQAAEENQCFFWSAHFSCQVTASVLSYLGLPATVVGSHRQRLRWVLPPVPTRCRTVIHAFALQHHNLSSACLLIKLLEVKQGNK